MAILETVRLTRQFGGLTALSEVDLRLNEGEILALIGPNGAGKTTMFNCLTGVIPISSGQVIFQGQEIGGSRPWEVARKGVARTYQNIRLFGRATVLDNVKIGYHKYIRSGFWASLLKTPAMRAEEREIERECLKLLEFVGIASLAREKAENLSYGDQRRLEVARMLALKPKVALLDEPTAGMNPEETAKTCDLIQSIRGLGISVILIEHDMNVVMGISDRIIVLNYGAKIAEGLPADIQGNQEVIEAYLGKES